MGFSNIPDNEVEVIPYHLIEIFIITDMGGLQYLQMRVVFAGAIPFNDFMPDSIDKGVEVLDKMVMRLYEDMIAGRISEQNFNTMLEKTQTEQSFTPNWG